MERAMLTHPAKLWLITTDLAVGNGYRTKMSPSKHCVSLSESQHHIINPANPSGAFDDRIQNRLHICRRAADNTEHLGRCRLMFEGFPQFCVAFLDLLEQSHVLNGDDRLVSEGLKQ